jgi:predicted RNA-binding Zn-ribbon protein involved in translation (DUF1610 family)
MSKRDFPCHSCGANVEFTPGVQSLKCPYCGDTNEIPQSEEQLQELDFHEGLAKGADTGQVERMATRCGACGAQVTLQDNVAADRCPFCDNPIVSQAEVTRVIQPKGLLPFKVEKRAAEQAFEAWLGGLWFAPSDLKRRARAGSIDGVYIPFWTYDCATESYYRGERGEYYYVTETYTAQENGQTVTKTREVRKTRWYSASGVVWVPFDDVLVVASQALPRPLTDALAPWDLEALVPYDDRYVAGFRSECYQVDLAGGFEVAKQVMDGQIRVEVRRDIGGDEQRIHSLKTRHYNITFKHILLPLWISAYRYNDKPFRYLVNARTGKVQGERPWSWVKITLAVLAALAVIAALVLLFKDK